MSGMQRSADNGVQGKPLETADPSNSAADGQLGRRIDVAGCISGGAAEKVLMQRLFMQRALSLDCQYDVYSLGKPAGWEV
ncbi:hypothetical protein Dda_1899 [Drechslerella dactyloides]|uniref:Uncharacterized protein n=1 Tax=Drechslerella dactyloides TaxID=74499 RepID=A0AAD6NL15_DREDA|nr:hypothetical protein Dda_1899 [Drechslerella dactyloides]